MVMDEDNDDGLGGRTRDRREVTEANRWSRPLCALTEIELYAAPLPDVIRDAVVLGRSIRSYRARDRQYQLIDKLVRTLEDDEIAAVDHFLAHPDEAVVRLDSEVDRLLSGGDEALQAWLGEHPNAERGRIRTLVRNAIRDPARRAALTSALAQALSPSAS